MFATGKRRFGNMSISSINGVNGYTAVKTAETEKASETTKDQVKDD